VRRLKKMKEMKDFIMMGDVVLLDAKCRMSSSLALLAPSRPETRGEAVLDIDFPPRPPSLRPNRSEPSALENGLSVRTG